MRTVDGKLNAQYVTDGSISANIIPPDAVSNVPVTKRHRQVSVSIAFFG
jgi:hypothetical protein